MERRGIIIHPEDISPLWPQRLQEAGLNVLGLHPVGGSSAPASLRCALMERNRPDTVSYTHLRRIVASRRQRVFRRQGGNIRSILLQLEFGRYRRGCAAARAGSGAEGNPVQPVLRKLNVGGAGGMGDRRPFLGRSRRTGQIRRRAWGLRCV